MIFKNTNIWHVTLGTHLQPRGEVLPAPWAPALAPRPAGQASGSTITTATKHESREPSANAVHGPREVAHLKSQVRRPRVSLPRCPQLLRGDWGPLAVSLEFPSWESAPAGAPEGKTQPSSCPYGAKGARRGAGPRPSVSRSFFSLCRPRLVLKSWRPAEPQGKPVTGHVGFQNQVGFRLSWGQPWGRRRRAALPVHLWGLATNSWGTAPGLPRTRLGSWRCTRSSGPPAGPTCARARLPSHLGLQPPSLDSQSAARRGHQGTWPRVPPAFHSRLTASPGKRCSAHGTLRLLRQPKLMLSGGPWAGPVTFTPEWPSMDRDEGAPLACMPGALAPGQATLRGTEESENST